MIDHGTATSNARILVLWTVMHQKYYSIADIMRLWGQEVKGIK